MQIRWITLEKVVLPRLEGLPEHYKTGPSVAKINSSQWQSGHGFRLRQGPKAAKDDPQDFTSEDNSSPPRTTQLYGLKHVHFHLPIHCLTFSKPLNGPRDRSSKIPGPQATCHPPQVSLLLPQWMPFQRPKESWGFGFTAFHVLFQFPNLKSHCGI